GIRVFHVTGVQTCALPIWAFAGAPPVRRRAAPAPASAAARRAQHAPPIPSRRAGVWRQRPGPARAPDTPLRAVRASAERARATRSEERRVGKECRARWAT